MNDNPNIEIWKDIEGYEGHYQVSDQSRIRSLKVYKGGGILKPVLSGNGYLKVHLSLKNNVTQLLVHRLSAIYFVPNPFTLPEVNHKDRVKINNLPANLEWCTKSYNNFHAYDTGHAWKRSVAQIDPVTGEVIRIVDRIERLKQFGINITHVGCVCSGKRKICSGYSFKYL